MDSKAYWANRAALDMVNRMESAEKTADRMSKASAAAEKALEKEMKAALRGVQSFGISEHEARTILNAAHDKSALLRLRAAANRVADDEHRKALLDAIDSAGAYRWRIGRLETLNKEINEQCTQLYKAQNRAITDCLKNVAKDSYYHSIFNVQQETGLAFSFAQIPEKTIDRILHYNWSGQSYSQRIWRDTNRLADQLKDELLVSMLSGRSGDKTARAISERFEANMYCARRLVRTESAYVANAATKESYSEAGISKYRFVAVLDNRTSELCSALDGKVFELEKAVAGTNYPPMHPFCRSPTIAVFDYDELKGMERRAKDENGNTIRVPADMTYREWYDRYVEQKTLDKSTGSGIIEVGNERDSFMYRKKDLSKIEPMPKKQFHKIKKAFQKNGGVVLTGDDIDAFLEKQHCEAVTFDAKTIAFRNNPGRAAVFEELIHTAQYRDGKNDCTYLSRILNEIEAQKMLIKNAKAYKLTEQEIFQTKKALVAYENELKEYNSKNGGV